MEKYNEYKDSGVQWLGEIPSHWEVVPFKKIANIILGKMLENAPDGEGDKYLCAKDVHMNSINYDDLKLMKFSPKEKKKYAVQKGDMLVVEGGASGSCAIVNEDVKNVFIQNSLMIARCGENVAYNPFASYMLNSMVNRGYAESVCNKATIMHFTKEKLGATLIALPPLSEQQAIASYLDTATAKIDEAIAQQQKMIDLLNERKQIIINNAVTKGLNPDAPMKDSGVDWIGEIPEHWICCSFRNIIDVLTDYTANGSFGDLAKNVNYQSEGYARLVRLTDLRENLENENGVWVDKHGYEYLSKSTLYGGELLMANVGAYSGLPCIMPKVEYLTTLAPNMFLIKQDVSKADTAFLFYLLSSYDYFNWLQTIALASAQPKLNKENIRSLQILLPPRVEQEQIVRHIQDKIKPLELSVSVAKQQISLLQERKQIIINDVVTGKVKVS